MDKQRSKYRFIPLEYKKKYANIFTEMGYNKRSRYAVQEMYKADYTKIFGIRCDYKPMHLSVMKSIYDKRGIIY